MRCLIVGPAKSGTTALLYAVANALGNPSIYFEEPVTKLNNLPDNSVAKIIFENEQEKEILEASRRFDRKILLVRDLRDNFVSRLLYLIAGTPKLLRDDAFVTELISLLQQKQQKPLSTNITEIVRLFNEDLDEYLNNTLECSNRFGRFFDNRDDGWFVLRYEDLVSGNLDQLSRYLGVPLKGSIDVDKEYSRVTRTKNSGDWRNWFTAADVHSLRPAFQSLLTRFGYEDNWAVNDIPQISPAHSWEFVLRLVHERRKHFGFQAYTRPSSNVVPSISGDTEKQVCNICGSTKFGPGPNGRTADSGAMPHCRSCGSLERQRILRRIFQALPIGFLDWRRGLQFSPDNGLNPDWFRSYEISVYGGENSLDIQNIDRQDASYDFVTLNHVLEFIPDDRKGFDELCRILSPRGIMQVCFSKPLSRETSQDFSEPFGPHQAWHLYGRDLARRLQCVEKNITVLVIEETDPCTGVCEEVHLFLKDADDATRIRNWLSLWGRAVVTISKFEAQSELEKIDTTNEAGSVQADMQLGTTIAVNIAPIEERDEFSSLRDELAEWDALSRQCTFWWRDDDLVSNTAQLQRMWEVSCNYQAPVLAAVIPALVDEALPNDTLEMSTMVFCQHGLAHMNHEPEGVPSNEFGASRAIDAVADDIRRGRERLSKLFGDRFFPVFVPPWNRLVPAAIPLLPELGFKGLSQYVIQPRHETSRLMTVNTHIDILQWSTAPNIRCQPTDLIVSRLVELLRERRSRQHEIDEPIGILSHHRVMQEDSWLMMQKIFEVTQKFDCVRWLSPRDVFDFRLEKPVTQ